MQALEEERSETVAELSDLFFVVQEMGQRLAKETHGDSYDLVLELNQILHRAREKIHQIERD